MTASLGVLPASNTETCGLSRLKNHSALLVRFAPCGQHLAHKTRRRDSLGQGWGNGLRQLLPANLARLEIEEGPSRNRDT
jgi:hypothetical protein